MGIKTFRGSIDANQIIEINLKTNDGKTGYKIVQLDVFPVNPDGAHESVIQVFTTKPATATMVVDFSDQTLIGAAWYAFEGSGSGDATGYMKQVFDNVIINQNIFVTSKGGQSADMNYHIALEQIRLSDNESTMATLSSIRSSYESYRPAGPS